MKLEDRIEYLKKQKMREKYNRPWYKKWWGALLLLLLLVILVYAFSFAMLIFRLIKNPMEMEMILRQGNIGNIIGDTSPSDSVVRIIEGSGSYFLGNKDAENTMVLFSDFTCPYCKASAETIASLAIKHGEILKIIVRDFPVLSEGSVDLAMAARCAGEQGRYWPMYYKMFELQGSFSSSDLNSIAFSSGVNNIEAFSDCFLSDKYLNDIIKDLSDGQYLKVSATPAWFINGYNAGEGAIPFSVWDSFLTNLKNSDSGD